MDIRIEEIEAQQVAGIRTETAQTEIGDKIGQLLGEIMPQVGAQIAGAPLAVYHTWEGDHGEMEVAVPIRAEAVGTDRIKCHDLPGGRAIVATHIGPYDQLQSSWDAIGSWMKEKGLTARAAPWEQYISDCSEVAPEQLETRIIWPIE